MPGVPAAELAGGPPPAGLYLHVPFCRSICPYCDFVVMAGRAARGPGSRIGSFLRALRVEIGLRADLLDARSPGRRPPLASLYLGGGTPSLLDAAAVAGLVALVDERFGLAADAEITIEVNPGADERGDLAGFRAAGVTRCSIGAQSLDPADLRALGRRHLPDDAAATVQAARDAGIGSVSIDLLMGVPGQDLARWEATLRAAIALEPDHCSTYQLTLDDPDEEGLTGPSGDHLPLRPGARRWRERARLRQDEEVAASQDERADALLGAAGFRRYELANHARPGHESRHNRHYWERRPVLAAGPGAHAFDGMVTRSWNAAALDGWLAALLPADGRTPRLPPGDRIELSAADALSETAILGLRLADGIGPSIAADPAIAPALAWAAAEGLAIVDAHGARLTPRGRLLSNELFARLLP